MVQFSSVAQSCLILCDPINRSTPGVTVHHQLPEFTQTHVHRVHDAILPSHPLSSPSPPAPNPSQPSGSFPMSQLFTWGGQSIGVSASASVLPMNSQDKGYSSLWFRGSYWVGFSCCRAQCLGAWASLVVACGLNSSGWQDLEHRLRHCWAQA